MTFTYEMNKENIYRWRTANPKRYYELNKPHIEKWRENNRERCNELSKISQRKYDAWKRITKIYRNILL